MLGRLGFVGRITAILLFAILGVLGAAGAWAYLTERSSGPEGKPALLPEQAAAVIELIESVPLDQRDAVLRAVNSDSLSVSISSSRPAVSEQALRMPGVEWVVSRLAGELSGRDVLVVLEPLDHSGVSRAGILSKFWLSKSQPVRLAVSLKPAGFVVFEIRGEASRKIFGLPAGFWLGVLGSLAGIAALRAIAKQAKPLAELARSVSSFSGEEGPVHVRPGGAPEIVTLVRAVNEMQDRIASLIKGRTLFLGSVSHDLKTYITRLRLRTELLDNDEQRLKAARDLDDMTALLNDALDVARGIKSAVRKEEIDLTDLLLGICSDQNSVSLISAPDKGMATISGDPVGLRRLFSNVVENAVRYGMRARVTVEQSNGRVRVLIDDDGPGIPEGERLAVFEPFYRLEGSRSRETGGTGLGLAIAKRITEAHGGTIEFQARPPAGTRAVVAFDTIQRSQQPPHM